jgi:hypothetical protein
MIVLKTKYNSTPFFWKLIVITSSGEVIATQVFINQVEQDIAAIKYYIKRYEGIFLGQAGVECYVIDEDEYHKGMEGGDVRECNPKACFYPCGDKPFYKKKFCY